MIIFDAHCDTASKVLDTHQELYRNKCHFDLERAKNYGGYIQFFAAFIDPAYCPHYPLKRCMQILDELHRQVELNSQHITIAVNHAEAMQALSEKKVAAFITVEGGEALQGDIRVLRMLYRLGVRSICLTWNGRNEIADGVEEEESKGGLTVFGREVVQEMNRLGMLIDVSHIAPSGFWDVLELTAKPVIASHSNAKALCNHRRNLTKEQFEAIIKNGGVVGINFYPLFLSQNGQSSHVDIIRHIEYFMSLGGENHIGLGGDFDGIDSTPCDVKGIEDMETIMNKLLQMNYSQELVDKVSHKNFLRVLKNVLQN